ncbi:YigZ family protein [Bacillus piscicola]|uniref:YigZ family protein n=1 Tax=Bacillus piscicola TaxID=1632684 RepID=UPI001F092CD6
MLESYYTVKPYGSGEIVINKSRFICHVKRVTTEKEAQAFIQSIKKDHWNATHNCSAYMIGEKDEVQKANDDGEPSGTAGIPMLEVLKKRTLKDTCVVVTRYFGGIKLGAGGLIRAYSSAVTEGLRATGIVERCRMAVMAAKVDYTWIGKLENELRTSSYLLKNIIYEEDVTFFVYVPVSETAVFTEWITNLTNGQLDLTTSEDTYLEKDASF